PAAEAQCRSRRVRGGVAAADHEHVRADRDRTAQAGLAEELHRADHAPGVRGRGMPPPDVLAEREEHRVVFGAQRGYVIDAGGAADLDAAEIEDLGDLFVQDLLGQMPGGDAGPQHAARLAERFEDHAGVAAPAEVVRGGQATGAGPDDGDCLAVERRDLDRLLGELKAEVTEEPLHGPDADGFVVFRAVAGRLARVVADPAGDAWHRVVLEDRAVTVEVAVVLDEVQVLLDLLAGGAGVIAGRGLVLIDRAEEAEVAGGKEPLAFLLGGRGSDARDGKPQVLGDVRAAN